VIGMITSRRERIAGREYYTRMGLPERCGGRGSVAVLLDSRTDSTQGGPILAGMIPGFIEPCLPSPADELPSGPDWVHEIKHDGFRLMARRDPVCIKLLTRNGHDWASRYPLIVQAVNKLKVRSCLIDGEAVCCNADGLPTFDKLRFCTNDQSVFLIAFDLLELDGNDLRREPLEVHKATLASAWMSAGCAVQWAPAASGRCRLSTCLQDGARRHRVEAAGLALQLRAHARLAQVQEPRCAGSEARGGGGLGQKGSS
jgi:hypothetical protein